MAYMLTKEKVQILCKFHLLFLIELAKKMNFLSVGKKSILNQKERSGAEFSCEHTFQNRMSSETSNTSFQWSWNSVVERM